MTTKAKTLETTRAALEDQLLDAGTEALPIHLVDSEDALEGLSDADRAWVAAQVWKRRSRCRPARVNVSSR